MKAGVVIAQLALLALLALAMALPVVPQDSKIPWHLVLPTLLLGIVALGAATALWSVRRLRYLLYIIGLVLLLVGGALLVSEKWLGPGAWGRAKGEQDIVIIIDGSASMTVMVDGTSNFDRAVKEAERIVSSLKSGDAVSIIVAGARPVMKTKFPIANEERLKETLARLQPTGDTMNLTDALNAAVIALAEGRDRRKKIVVITDVQKAGGRTDWSVIAKSFSSLPSKSQPRLIVFSLPMPKKFRNVRVGELKMSPKIIGPDRDAAINVRVENTGTEGISTRFEVELLIDGRFVEAVSIDQLNPEAAEPVRFDYRFERGGVHSVEVRAILEDDLMDDNAAATMVRTMTRLPVLVIDGNPSPRRPLESASAFIELALAPSVDPVIPASVEDTDVEKESRALIDVTVVSATEAVNVQNFAEYEVVILADVPRLPSRVASAVARFVSNGGGLLIAAGERSVPAFYNDWGTPQGAPIVPALLSNRQVVLDGKTPPAPAPSTFDPSIFSVIADRSMASGLFTAYWQVETDANDIEVSVRAALDTGEPMVIERRRPKGRILMTAVSLDNRGSNLPGLDAFLPFVHEMVYALVPSADFGLVFDPSNHLTISLSNRVDPKAEEAGTLLVGTGLRGDYFSDPDFGSRRVTRLDAGVRAGWGGGAPVAGVPKDDFSVRWTGSIVPQKSATYTFHLAADDRAELWIDGKSVVVDVAADRMKADEKAKEKAKESTGTVKLERGRAHAIRIEFVESTGASSCHLWWSAPGVGRQAVPRQLLRPDGPWVGQFAKKIAAKLVPPVGSTRSAVTFEKSSDKRIVRIEGATFPGLHRVPLEGVLADGLQHMRVGDSLAFVVLGQQEESELKTIPDKEFKDARQHVDIFLTKSSDNMVHMVIGGIPGQRLWKYLAWAALVAALLEVALARWIAVQRKTGAARVVDFTSATDAVAYRSRAEAMLDTDSGKGK